MILHKRFFFVSSLYLSVLLGPSLAIVNKNTTTVKPPNRQEPVSPWYFDGASTPSGEESSGPAKRYNNEDERTPRHPMPIDGRQDNWNPWRKTPGSEIEQRTKVHGSPPEEDAVPQHRNFDQTEFNLGFDSPFYPSREKSRDDVTNKENTQDKTSPTDSKLHVELETWGEDFYEGVPSDSKKPRRGKILVNKKPKTIVAKYDSTQGVQCPDADASGQFVYPLDCKFFVNCWQGRAVVQPCAPGTLFNPETLECDFPFKVKCYSEEMADLTAAEDLRVIGSERSLSSNRGYLIEEKLQGPTCPSQVTGLFSHPTDCTKFLQCANGGTVIMDCGAGTVFNPAISVCDWPRNVLGCEDALKSDDENTPHPMIPPNPNTHGYSNQAGFRAKYNAEEDVRRISCPPDFTGLLPHPETCYEFLQCDRGGTFVRGCGPGTAFNPEISVCDWPYNVPSCGEGKKISSQDSGHSGNTWEAGYGATQPGYGSWKPTSGSSQSGQGSWKPASGSSQSGQGSWKPPSGSSQSNDQDSWNPNLRPTQYDQGSWHGTFHSNQGSWQSGHNEHVRPSTISPRPPWRRTWKANYNPNNEDGYSNEEHEPGQHFGGYHHHQQHDHQFDNEDNDYSSNESHDYHDHHHGYQPPTTGGQLPNYLQPPPPPPQPPTTGGQLPDYLQPPPPPPQPPTTGGQLPNYLQPPLPPPQPPTTGGQLPNYLQPPLPPPQPPTTGGQLPNYLQPPPPPYPHHHHHHHSESWNSPHHHGPSEEDENNRQIPDTNFDQSHTSFNENPFDNTYSGHVNNRARGGNRGNYDRIYPKFPYSGSNNFDRPVGHVYSDNHYNRTQQLPSWNRTPGSYNPDYGSYNRTGYNRNTWSQPDVPGNRPGVFRPSTWSDGRGSGPSRDSSQGRWNQGGSKPDDRPDKWPSNTNVYQQSTADREADSKMNHWSGRTNVFQQSRGKVGPGVKITPTDSQQTQYPDELYVTVNGVKGHYITKEIEVNQGHSQTRNYNKNNTRLPEFPNRNNSIPFESSYNRSTHRPPYPGNDFSDLESANSHHAVVTDHALPGSKGDPASRPNTDTVSFSQNAGKIPDKHLIILSRRKLPETMVQTSTEKYSTTTNPNLPRVSIENEEESPDSWLDIFNKIPVLGKNNLSSVLPEFEPEIQDYDVKLLDEKEVWKPKLVYENKTQTTTESSVIMKISDKKEADTDLFNVEPTPFAQEEPQFPVYYVPPLQLLHSTDGSKFLTPISGQIIRLRGGRGPSDGYVEIQGTQPGWGIVCDSRNGWTLKEAHVVCRQLGYIRGAEMAWQGRNNVGEIPSWIAANAVTCSGNETLFQTCKFNYEETCRVERDAIGVRCFPNRVAHCRKDEVPHEGQCYHLADPESGLNHAEALNYCSSRNARLLDVTSQAENTFISEWLVQKYPHVASVMTSGVGFNMFNNTIWLWEDSSRAKFKFTKWWPGWLGDKDFPPRAGLRPVCVTLKRKFPCHERPDSICVADYFFWDVEDCAANMKGHSYICKRPYDDIGCVYGKGNQYAGHANVTASGAACLPWKDEKVAHSLLINVINREAREKLKTHNYCRNPNPYKESHPWCFAAPNGQREYCDIPACGNVDSKRSLSSGVCKPKHFQCQPGECIPSPWVCDGEEDCTNGADERACLNYVNLFRKTAKRRLEGHDVEMWLNTPLKTCALRCKEADFTCRSFAHKANENMCVLSDNNIGMSGALTPNVEFDYYEMIDRSLDCTDLFVCDNGKCISQTQVCNGKNDCNDRSDERICTAENLDYDIRLAGSQNNNEGRIEVKVFGQWGQVCDDGFGMVNADVICKELGFDLGALEVKPGGIYGNLDPPTRFMVDQLKCRGNETSLRECDFEGWGVHNCEPEEAVGIVCKTAVDVCQQDHWKCVQSPTCIPTRFLCDEVVDCPDGSDEASNHCDAPFMIRLANGSSPMEGRVEVRHHGVWGTVCDDDFSMAAASVVCRSLGYNGRAITKKNGFFGPGNGLIWLDDVWCSGNETHLYRCDHKHWGIHNCDHTEDVGVVCSVGDLNDPESSWSSETETPLTAIEDLLPSDCGKRAKDFDGDDEDLIFERVVRGSVAPKGTYPWQATIRIRGISRTNHWCGAVIISPLHVLTAAHCLEGYNKAAYYVRAGDYNTEVDEGTEVEANIEDYYVHEKFRKGHKMNNDIALVLLKGSGIPLGKHIMPICLPSEDTAYPAGLNCTISGFGTIETGKFSQAHSLRYGWIPLVDQSVCGASYGYGKQRITEGMLCAGYLDEGVDTCEGDSGGPLACLQNGAFTLYGITSWGQKCGEANKPGVYVRVAYYRQWINQKIRESLIGR